MKRTIIFALALVATLVASAQTKSYKVGDLYDEGGLRGVVFEVSNDGQHGKIVSAEQTPDWIKWCIRTAREVKLEMSSRNNGRVNTLNMRKVESMEDWQTLFPVYAWLRSLGNEAWYLPAVEEAVVLARVSAQVNATLEKNGYKKLYYYLWTSTEENGDMWMIDTTYADTYLDSKGGLFNARAIARF